MVGRWETLAGSLRGAVIRPDDPRYDSARAVWNGDVDRRPRAVVRCRDTADVRSVVGFASANGLPVAVRGGGHSVAGHAVCDEGIVIDLTQLRAVRVDPAQRCADVQGGALWRDVDAHTQRHGLVVTGGLVSHTGVGGLTLGGGLGHVMRRCGLTLDNLEAVELVTAQGSARVVEHASDPDLFWALRGGGGNFGVVTRFRYRLHPLPATVLGGMLIWSFAEVATILAGYRDLVEDAPDALGTVVNLRLCPPNPAIPRELHGRLVVAVAVCWTGDADEGQGWLRRLRALGRPLVDTVGPVDYTTVQSMSDSTVEPGNHYYWRSAHLHRLDDGVIATLAEHAERITSPLSAVPIYHLGGAVNRVPADATAYGPRDALHNINMFAGWYPDDADRDRHVAWARSFSDAVAPYAAGRYVNFLSDEGPDAVAGTYGTRWRRLVDVKRRTDPDNVFRFNYNIDPEAGRTVAGSRDSVAVGSAPTVVDDRRTSADVRPTGEGA